MAQLQSLETKVPMKSPEKIAACFRNRFTALPQLLPDLFKTAEVLGGGHKMGPGDSVMLAKYSLPGAPLISAKIKWEAMGEEEEEEGKSITFTVMEGEILELYKSFIMKVDIDRDAGQATWSMQYEPANPNIPPPHAYLEAAKQISIACDNSC